MYKEELEGLKQTVGDKGVSYDKHCLTLSDEEVKANLEKGMPYVIRQNNPNTGTTTFKDEIYGEITVQNIELNDMVLIKSDGYPTYNFANVVDDHLIGITHMWLEEMSIYLPHPNIIVYMKHLAGKFRFIFTAHSLPMKRASEIK